MQKNWQKIFKISVITGVIALGAAASAVTLWDRYQQKKADAADEQQIQEFLKWH